MKLCAITSLTTNKKSLMLFKKPLIKNTKKTKNLPPPSSCTFLATQKTKRLFYPWKGTLYAQRKTRISWRLKEKSQKENGSNHGKGKKTLQNRNDHRFQRKTQPRRQAPLRTSVPSRLRSPQKSSKNIRRPEQPVGTNLYHLWGKAV